ESPEALQKSGIHVVMGTGRFLDPHTVSAGEATLKAKNVLLTTGARPAAPAIQGLESVPYLTYETIFDNDTLPRRLIVVGGGPIGAEMAQASRRLGSEVTVVARELLPKDEPEARKRIEGVFAREGVRIARGRATAARQEGSEIVIAA